MSKEKAQIEMPFNAIKASKEVVEFLTKIGILYKDEKGLHVIDKGGTGVGV